MYPREPLPVYSAAAEQPPPSPAFACDGAASGWPCLNADPPLGSIAFAGTTVGLAVRQSLHPAQHSAYAVPPVYGSVPLDHRWWSGLQFAESWPLPLAMPAPTPAAQLWQAAPPWQAASLWQSAPPRSAAPPGPASTAQLAHEAGAQAAAASVGAPPLPTIPRVILGDCVEGMRALPTCSVDCVIADPPYNIGVQVVARPWATAGAARRADSTERGCVARRLSLSASRCTIRPGRDAPPPSSRRRARSGTS